MDAQRDELIRIVGAIRPLDAIEAEHRHAARSWLASDAGIYRLAKPATPPKHLVVYAAILDPAERQLLLIQHSSSGLWLPTGGHVDPGEPPFAAARRELMEETGRELLPISDEPLFITVQETVGSPADRHTDVTLWYGFAASQSETFHIDPVEADGCAWFCSQGLSAVSCDRHAARFLAKATANAR